MKPGKPGEIERVRAQLEVLSILGDSSDDYLFLWECETRRLYLFGDISKRYSILEDGNTFCTLEDWCNIIYEKDRPALRKEIRRCKEEKSGLCSVDFRMVDREGKRIWANGRGQWQMDAQGQPVAIVGRVSDTALEQKVDQLTGAFNGIKLAEDMRCILADGQPCYLLLVGVDNFKHINIRHGREYGSQLLCSVVEILEEILGGGRRIYRVNGDCFAVNLPVQSVDEVEEVYQQLRACMTEYCTLSAGVVPYHGHQDIDSNMLYQYAEEALDKAKRLGKDNLAVFSQKDYQEKLSTVELQEELRRSIQDGFSGFSLCYQPQIRARSYELYGAEALLRYHSPTRGPMSPAQFIPVLEQTGMICAVGLWVLKTALEQCHIWRRGGMPWLHISVNMSYTQLSQKNIAEQVLDILQGSGLPGDALTLEVTESVQLQDYPRFNRLFYQWKKAGIQISVDDFGTGYSSLAYLKNLEIDEIKMDRCFISGIQYSAYNYHLLKNMIELARSSQIRVCCEGVETQEELAVLEGMSPDLLQGYLFHRPLTEEDFIRAYFRPSTQEYQERMAQQKSLQKLEWNRKEPPKDQPITTATLESIIEALDEVVYISDPKTHELYYLNPAGRKLTGVYDYKGHKCYKVLQGKDSPCEFCNNDSLEQDRFQIWELDNQDFKQHFLVKDKLIDWYGSLARLEVASNSTQRELLNQAVYEKMGFGSSVLSCVRALAEETELSSAIRRMLATAVEFYQADRAVLFEPTEGGHEQWSATFEWCRRGISSQLPLFRQLLVDDKPDWLETLEEDETLIVSDIEQLREKDLQVWERLRKGGTRHLMSVPIHKGGRLVAFVGVDNPRHQGADDSMLRVLILFLINGFCKEMCPERLGGRMELRGHEVLKNTKLGLWCIRVDSKGTQREMFTDETMRGTLGLQEVLTPEACFAYWFSRIDERYRQYVTLTLESMVRSQRVVQLEYLWQHPTLGETMMRSIGMRMADEGGMMRLEGYHRILSDMDRPQFLPDTPTGEVFEFHPKEKTIRFHTGRVLLAGEKTEERNFPKCWLEEGMVHPHFVARFAALFQGGVEQRNVEGEEILLHSSQGSYDWFRLRTSHLEEEQDKGTILVLLDAADQERVLQLENMRIRDFYHASLSESIAYAEVDLEAEQLKAAGGLWEGFEKIYQKDRESLLQFMRRQTRRSVRPSQQMDFLWNVSSWAKLLSPDEPIRRFRYQRKIDGEWRWVELVAHSFREQFTENTYALLYLKDIDAQVRKERAQQDAANRDPLTDVYNRRAFEHAIREYVEDKDGTGEGVLILLDVDNFKLINDRMGHLEGDAALQYVVKLLHKTFRQGDLLGRLGGDEFMVFLKGSINPEILDRRMQSLFQAMRSYSKMPITCSAGIVYVHRDGFDYQESILRADMALYHSKQDGKGRYTYAEEQKETFQK